MFDRYEKKVIETLDDILTKGRLDVAPESRAFGFDELPFVIVANDGCDHIRLCYGTNDGTEVFIDVFNWKKRWIKVVELFASIIKAEVEG